jgi:hypothetical protein
MRVSWASVAAPGRRVNEDCAFHAGDLVGLLDGVSLPPGMESGCVHGVAWYARHLARRLVAAARPDAALADALGEAIAVVRADHGGSCDLGHPGTPAATVCLLRHRDGGADDYLVLGDSPLVLDGGVVTDGRFDAAVADLRAEIAAVPDSIGSPEHDEAVRRVVARQRERTNRDGGYWIAAANPDAARHAVTGEIRPRRAALLTDGAFDPLSAAGLGPGDMLDLAAREGPAELIRRAHAAPGRSGYKRHDDASVVYLHFSQNDA